jgi:hypothetical protein
MMLDMSTPLPEYLQIDLIGEILQSFLNQYNLQQCLQNVRNYAHGTFFHIQVRDVSYTGTFFDSLTTTDGAKFITNSLSGSLTIDFDTLKYGTIVFVPS